MIGVVGRQLEFMRRQLPVAVARGRADHDWASAEIDRMAAVLRLLEDIRAGAGAAPERQPKVHLSLARTNRRRDRPP
jgi:hypothetical protein